MIWTDKITTNSHDPDGNGIIRPAAAIRYVQEAVNRQCHYNHPGTDELLADGKGFILSRIVVDFPKPLYAYEDVEVDTWPIDSTGVRFIRYGRIRRGGEAVMRTAMVWALVDISSRRLLRSSDLVGWEWLMGTTETLDLPVSGVLRIPDEVALTERGRYTVGYRDVDIYHHMNNTVYPDIICGALPNFGDRRVTGLTISFLSEAPFAETITILTSEADENGRYYVRTIREDGRKNIEAVVETEQVASSEF